MAKVNVEHEDWKFKESGDVVLAICTGDAGTKTRFVGNINEESAFEVGYAFGCAVSALEDEDPELARCMRAGLHASIELEVS